MLNTRVIPILLLKKRGLYKGIKFKNHKYVGDPINTVKLFNDKEVDELIILDIESSKLYKPIDFEYIHEVVSEAFMPIGYGGGIKSLDDAKKIFSIGVEKVILNTHAIKNKELVKKIINIFGSQSVVLSLDFKSTIFGKKVFIKSGTENTSLNPIEIAIEFENLGIGEIILNDIDRDGTMKGFNLQMINKVSSKLKIPLIACGGAGNFDDILKAKNTGAHAIAAGSIFVFHGPHRAVLISYPKYKKIRELLGEKINEN